MSKRIADIKQSKIAILGMGYVGLPLAIEFAKATKNDDSCKEIIGYDISEKRINELSNAIDRTKEISKEELLSAKNITFSTNRKKLTEAEIFIVTVPTPIDEAKNPNLEPLISASNNIGKILKEKNNNNIAPIIIYESTVYPGATEEVCVREIERVSGLQGNIDFYYGYSPERINPGDKTRKLSHITKITSGSTKESSEVIDNLYKLIIHAGTYLAPSIKVAESAKVIENIQRDINIALVNELAIIFEKLGIDTLDVLKAAGTKWNFLKFQPGLVGGHCIGVDPYYLTYKSQIVGYTPEIVLAGRRLNDSVGTWIINRCILEMVKRNITIKGSKALILGATFKEDCPDLRNTKITGLVKDLKRYELDISIYDPIADQNDSKKIFNCNILNRIGNNSFDLVICAVPHSSFKNYNKQEWGRLLKSKSILFDLKGIVPRDLKQVIRI